MSFRNKPKNTAKYLNQALSTGEPVRIEKAIGDMIRAQGSTDVARKAGLPTEGLYTKFGAKQRQHPGFESVIKVLRALNVELLVQAKK